jgi:hypothetical protein
MPIDPSIPLSGQTPKFNDPFAVLASMRHEAEQSRLARENSAALNEQRQAIAEQRQQQTAKAQQDAAEATALRSLKEWTPETVYPIVGPQRGAEVLKGISALHEQDLKTFGTTQNLIGTFVGAIKALPEDLRPEAYGHARDNLIAKGVTKPEDIPEKYDPGYVDQVHRWAMTPAQQADADKPITLSAGQTAYDPHTRQPLMTAPTAPKEVAKPASVQEFEYAVSQGYKGTFSQYQTEDANRKRPAPATVNVGTGSMLAQTDPKAIADGIKRGELLPVLGEYSRAVQGAIATELARSGYNLASARTDWNATQKHVASLNGAQQLRLNQAVNALPDLLDKVDEIASRWKGGRFPILNNVNLKAAQGGAYGKDVAVVANELSSQIADVTADLAVAYMGGNSPTDHGLNLAAKSLSADWDEKVLHSMVKLAKDNVQIRKNSIANVGVSGASAANPYAGGPGNIQDTGAKTPPGATPPAVQNVLKGQKDGHYTLTDGTKWTVSGGQVSRD